MEEQQSSPPSCRSVWGLRTLAWCGGNRPPLASPHRPNGTKITNDGNVVITHYPDGHIVHEFKNGTKIETYPDRRKVQTNPDGTRIVLNSKDSGCGCLGL